MNSPYLFPFVNEKIKQQTPQTENFWGLNGWPKSKERLGRTRGSWQKAWDRNVDGSSGHCMIIPLSASSVLPPALSQDVLSVLNLLLTTGTIHRVLFLLSLLLLCLSSL